MFPHTLTLQLQGLPGDVLFSCFCYLTVKDILSLRRVSKALQRMSRSKQLWLIILERDVVSDGPIIPHYCRPLELLSDIQTEALVLHILRLRQALLLGTQRRPPTMVSFPQTRSVTWAKLVQGKWVLVACSDQTTSAICLWSLQSFYRSEGPPDIVAQAFLKGPVVYGLVEVQNDQVIIALELRAAFQTIVEIISLRTSSEGRPTFVRLRRFIDDVSHIRCLRGPFIGFALHRERSIPSVLDWRTGEVANLCRTAGSDGGAVAMAIDDDGVVAVVTPRNLELYKLHKLPESSVTCEWLCSILLGRSVGWAQAMFTLSTSSKRSRLCVCIGGENGLFAYIDTMDHLCSATEGTVLTPVWGRGTVTGVDWKRYKEQDSFAYSPIFSTHGRSLAWLVVAVHSTRPIGFGTLAEGLPAGRSHTSTEYRLDHPDLPGMFAAGVYDYDETLGVTVFGNACGELAVFNLSALRIAPLEECFEALPIPDGDGRHGFEVMSETTIPATFGLPFPYLGPLEPPREYAELLFAQWRTKQPNPIPLGWERDGISEDGTPLTLPLDWTNLTPRIPSDIMDIGWHVEHAYHCIGPLVPLMKNYRYSLYTAGGLLLLWEHDSSQQLSIISADLTFDLFLTTCQANGISRVPMTPREWDFAAFEWGKYPHRMWAWEGGKLGRNRWQELQARGGDVHPDWLTTPPNPAEVLRGDDV